MDNDDDDFLDGCDLDFAAAAEDEETADLRVLFPHGEDDAELAPVYEALAVEAEGTPT